MQVEAEQCTGKVGSRLGPQHRRKNILVDIFIRALFWQETWEKSGDPLISTPSHLAFLSSFRILLFHGYSYRHHRGKGLFLILVPNTGKEGRKAHPQIELLAWGNSNTPLQTFEIFSSNWKILPLPQTGCQVNVEFFFQAITWKIAIPNPFFIFPNFCFLPCTCQYLQALPLLGLFIFPGLFHSVKNLSNSGLDSLLLISIFINFTAAKN